MGSREPAGHRHCTGVSRQVQLNPPISWDAALHGGHNCRRLHRTPAYAGGAGRENPPGLAITSTVADEVPFPPGTAAAMDDNTMVPSRQ